MIGRRPRVLLVLPDLGPTGGAEQACTELIRRGSSEFDFTVVSTTLSADLRTAVRWVRVPVIGRPFPLKFASFFALGALQVARQRADIVHAMGAIVPNRIDIATVHFCHAGYYQRTGRLAQPEDPAMRRLNRAVGRLLALAAERWCYRPSRTSHLAAVSAGVAAEAAHHYRGMSIHVTPNGVDPARFGPRWAGRSGFRKDAGAGEGDIVTLFVGGDWTRKGLPQAIRGLAQAQEDVRQTMRLWIVGRGEVKRFAELARSCRVADRVHFFGPQSRVEHFYQSADIFVLPSSYETFSLAAFEAAACGLPVVATRVSGVDELVGQDQAGILVERDAGAVGAALRRLGLESMTRVRMGDNGRRRAAAFTWQHSADAVLTLYREILAARAPSSEAQPLFVSKSSLLE